MSSEQSRMAVKFVYSMAAAAAVYVFAHWDGLTNPHVIADDVRQQLFWMQQWIDPALFQGDLLTEYSKNYVPIGVKAVYRVGCLFMDPIDFTKVVTGILYLVTAGFIFGLATAFKDDITPVLAVCVFLFFGAFMRKISGGLSQGFAFPLFTAYLFFLSRDRLLGTAAVMLITSLFNPYIFILCLVTQGLFLLHTRGRAALAWIGLISPKAGESTADFKPGLLGLSLLITAAGCGLMAAQYVFTDSSAFGRLVTWNDMVGKVEYTDQGRYELWPVPSLFYEIIRPWIFNLPFIQWGLAPSWFFASLGMAAAAFALKRKVTVHREKDNAPESRWGRSGGGDGLHLQVHEAPSRLKPSERLQRKDHGLDLSGFRIFAYLFPASVLLFAIAGAVIMNLFVPRRYVQFSLNVFYCLAMAVSLRVALSAVVSGRVMFPVVTTLMVILAALRMYHVGLQDYSDRARFYAWLKTAPKTSLFAGHPDLMDNVVTFGHRKAFVTYELSHTWYMRYWDTIKKRTYDFFDAYYSDDPAVIRRFCLENGVDYLVVRDEDFSPKALAAKDPYFEPFGARIADAVKDRKRFAVLDRKEFPPVYMWDGVAVIKFPGKSGARKQE